MFNDFQTWIAHYKAIRRKRLSDDIGCYRCFRSWQPDRHHSNHVEHQCKAEELWPTHQIARNVQGQSLLQVLLGCTEHAHAEVILNQPCKGNQWIKVHFPTETKSADSCRSQGRGGAWDYRSCGTFFFPNALHFSRASQARARCGTFFLSQCFALFTSLQA